MIDIIFQYGPEIILVKISGTKVTFGNTKYGAQMADISGLILSKEGVMKEHPDLKDNPFWKDEAIKRFKDHIRRLKTEKLIMKYIKEDLEQHGYVAKRWQQNGYRGSKF